MEHRSITITTETIIKTIVVLALGILLFVLRDVALIVLTSIIIASAIDPGVRYLVNKKIPRVFGVIIVYFLLAVVASFVLLYIVPTFLQEASGIVANIPLYISQMNNFIPLLDESILQGYVPFIKEVAAKIATVDPAELFSTGTSDFLGAASALIEGTLNVLFVFVLSFYFSVIEDGVAHFLRIITPAQYEAYIAGLWKRTKNKIGAWMQGQLLLGALVGFLIYAMLAILGIKHALLLAVLAAIFEIIPVFGPVLAAIPAVILALLDKGVGLAGLVLGWYIIVQQLENNLFYPLVVKKIVGVSPLIVMIALVVGAKLAGFLGIILSVPVSVLIMEFIDDLDKKKAGRASV